MRSMPYRVILEEQLAPLVLDVEEEAEDEEEVSERDKDDHHEAAVQRHLAHPAAHNIKDNVQPRLCNRCFDFI
jgi:hypothetical protein